MTAPAVDEIPSSCRPTIHMSMPRLGSYTLKGVYPVHPMFAAPSHMMTPAVGMSQNESALIRGKAMSFAPMRGGTDRKSTRLNSSHLVISYAVFCLKKKK